ncbi:HlyC/CorC family transporter [Pseudoflavonifractor sp. AF19-9AC]|nr:HlyC/CorC family transporter [Pseudoflavonifractor sp. AF19-9AC]
MSVSGDQIWPILFCASLAGNIALLRRPVLKLLRREKEVSEDNIMAMVEEGEESGTIQSNEKELIENVFEFDTMTAKDVMVHRTDMVTLALDEDEETIVDTIRQSGLSRFPVYQEDVDDIIGILSTREYLLNFRLPDPKPIKELLRPAYFVPETVPADVLFRDMQGKKTHMALVVDEYGGTSGLVTLEDLLEELVGNIYDEFDPQEEQDIIRLEDNKWRVSGSADLEELAEAMELELPEDEERDYDTLGGLVFSQLSVIPKDGSRPVVEAMGLRIRVEELCDRRVEWALVEKLSPVTQEAKSDVHA